MRAAVTGAGGQLGRALGTELERCGHASLAWTRAELDVADREAVRRWIREAAPEVVFHAAAFTDVDRAESEPEAAAAVNELGAGHVAAACRECAAFLVHVSTDYVFDGAADHSYRPDDEPRPLNVYGSTKLAGERRVRESGAEHLIARTSWVYGVGPANFVRTVLRLAAARRPLRIVDDQVGSPTWTETLAAALVRLAELRVAGLLHVADDAGREGVSRHAQAVAILEEAGVALPVEAVLTSAMPRPARRPAWSVLDVTEAERALGAPLPPWRDSLRRMLAADAETRELAAAARAGAAHAGASESSVADTGTAAADGTQPAAPRARHAAGGRRP